MHTMIQLLSNPAYRSLRFIEAGIFFILVALPLLMKKVPVGWYGFRIPKTVSDERIWYPANVYAAKGMILTGIITIVVAVVLRLTDMPPKMYQLVCTHTFLGAIFLTTIQ